MPLRNLQRLFKMRKPALLNETNLSKYFWADAVNTACYVPNRVLIRPILKKTSYELFKGRKPNISHFRVFGCKCFILNNGKNNLGKFDSKADEGIFLGYSSHSHAYRAYNKRTVLIEETVHITFDETNQKVQNKSQNSADDEEAKRLQGLKETAAEQNENKTEKLGLQKKKLIYSSIKSICLWNGEFQEIYPWIM